MCTATECSVEYTRGKLNVQNDYDFIKKRVPSFDRTVDNNCKHSSGNFGLHFTRLLKSYEKIALASFFIRSNFSQNTECVVSENTKCQSFPLMSVSLIFVFIKAY